MIGTHLSERYELTLLLQEGPIFAAYHAKDKVLGRDVTVRVIKPPFSTEPHFLMKLREVVKHAGSVENPGVEKLLDLVDDPNVSYLVSEFSKGSVLAERIRKLAPYSVAAAVSMVVSIVDGLEAIHNSGFVHGDPGAHNIIIGEDGSARLELTGVWEAYSASETAGAVVLPAMAPYLAPEVSAGGLPTPASDVYAVGIILYQLLTGRFPYVAETPVATAMRHTSTPTPSVRAVNASVPAALDDVIKRAMAKEPSARYRNATQLLEDLKRIEGSVRFGKAAAIPARPAEGYSEPVPLPAAPVRNAVSEVAPRPPRAQRPIPEEREPRDVPLWMVVAFTFVLTVVAVMIGGWYWFSSSAPQQLKVPNIVGKSRSDAESQLGKMDLQLRVSKTEVNEKYPLDTVIESSPSPGQEVKQGGVVVVVLSGGSRLVTVPDLRGKTPDQAREILSSINLDLDRTDPIPTSKMQPGLIVRQSPDPKTKVERASRVNVGVSTAPLQQPPAGQADNSPPAPGVQEQNASSRYLYTIKIRLTKITEPVVLRVDITDSNGTRKIYEAQHYPNEEVSIRTEGFGEHAVFRIYYNGEFVTQVSKQADQDTGNGANGDNGDNGDSGSTAGGAAQGDNGGAGQ